jgi:two-component system cell cycle sensor histidine kinase/response regulator CckA
MSVSDSGRKTDQLTAEIEMLRGQLAVLSGEAESLRESEARLRGLAERAASLVESLRDGQRRYQVLFESTHEFVAELDAEGRVLFVSPSCEAILGYKPQDLVGTTPFALLHEDDAERLADSFLRRVEERRPTGPGSLFRVRSRDGGWRWLQGGGTSYATSDGRTRLVCVCRDMSGQIRAEQERRQLDAWVQETRRFESLGVLAGGIAHDFNNLLTPILGEASLVLLDLPEDSPLRARLDRIRSAAQRAASLTAQMVHYAGGGAFALCGVDLSQLVAETRPLLESAAAGRARLRFELATQLPAVEGDPARLARVVRNLVENAAEASDEGGLVVVRTGAVAVDRAALAASFLGHPLPEGMYVRLEVEDRGAGMSGETRARLFDPFFSTKFTGRGLGLAAVLGIVRGHRGAIDVESSPGRGTRVAVLLPAETGAVAARSERVGAAAAASGAVLVVDDDEGVRAIASEALRRAGFTPVCAVGPADALQRLRRAGEGGADGAGFCAVVLDWTLADADGGTLRAALREIRPDLPVVLVSGHAPEIAAPAPGEDAADAFLQKPFHPADLARRVRELIGNRYRRPPPWSSITS